MGYGQTAVFGCAANFLPGKKCIFCGSFKVNRTGRGYVKCRVCPQQKSRAKLRREISIIQGFYLRVCVDVMAVAVSRLLGINRNTINAYYGVFRRAIMPNKRLNSNNSPAPL